MGRGERSGEGRSSAEPSATRTRAKKPRTAERDAESPRRPTKRKKPAERADDALPPEVFSTLTAKRLAEAPTLAPIPALEPEPAPRPNRSLVGVAALAVGLLGGVAVVVAVAGRGTSGRDDGSTAAAVQPAKASSQDDERTRQLTGAAEGGDARAMLDLARHLTDRDPSPEELQRAIGWVGRVKQATSDGSLLEEAGDLEARLLGEARQRAIASRNAAEADAQAAWEKDAPKRRAAEAAWAKEEERTKLRGQLSRIEALVGPEAKGPAVAQAGKLLAELPAGVEADEQIAAALVALKTRLGVARDRVVEQALVAAKARLGNGDPAGCLKELGPLTGIPELPSEVGAVRTQAETAIAVAAATKRQEAEAAAAKSREAAAAELSQAKEALAARQKAAAAIETELRDRAEDWYEARDPRELTCSDCKGQKEVEHKACKGTQWGKCGNCGGSGRIISVGGGGGEFSCNTCGGSGRLRCGRCTMGKVACDCTEDFAGALAGFRELGGQRAFWEFTSPAARKGKRRQDHFAGVARGLELAEQVGEAMPVAAARIDSVWVQDEEAEVRARVRWMRPWGPSSEVLHVTRWIREEKKLYLLAPGSAPERLLPELTAAQRKVLKLPETDLAPPLPDLPRIALDEPPVASVPTPPRPTPTPPPPPAPTPPAPAKGKPAEPAPPPPPPTKLDAQPAKPDAQAEPKEDLKAVEAEAKALLADPALQKKLAAVQEEARKRADAWLESREEKELRCKECEGLALVTDPRCRGTQRMACRTCNGDGSIVTRQRGKQHRVTCTTCNGDTTEPCIAPCKEGRIDCPACVKEGVPGFRPLAGKHAFWDFISAAARKGRKAPDYFRDVVEGRVLGAARGRSVALSRAAVKSVFVLKNRVVVTAEVEWASAPGSSDLLVTTWVREKDRLWLLQPGDALVPLLE